LRITNNDIATLSDRFVLFFKSEAALPINFITQNIARNEDKIELTWKMSDTSLVAHYSIERSEDGISFNSISQTIVERYTDNSMTAFSNYFYRIACHQKNCHKLYSKILKITAINAQSNEITVMPNPVGEDRYITVAIDKEIEVGDYVWELWSMDGKRMMHQNILMNSAQKNLHLQIDKKIMKGAYVFRLTIGNKKSYQSKIIYR
jgi:hypothetical protein